MARNKVKTHSYVINSLELCCENEIIMQRTELKDRNCSKQNIYFLIIISMAFDFTVVQVRTQKVSQICSQRGDKQYKNLPFCKSDVPLVFGN